MSKKIILIVDDEASVRISLRLTLQPEFECIEAKTVAEATQMIMEREIDLILLDICLGRESGLDVLRFLHTSGLSRPVICVSGEAAYSDAMEAYRLGALDFLDKPLTQQKLHVTVVKCLSQHRQRERQHAFLQAQQVRAESQLLGNSKPLKDLHEQMVPIAESDAKVLILGETGTGKEAVASSLHHLSKRASHPFVVVDCGSLPANLMESILFGHKKGAFTGADQDQAGRLECAEGGTLFLDEIGELTLEGQNRLLRFLETGELMRVGSNKSVKIDARVIAATSRNIDALVKEGKFRADLFFRLSVFTLRTPALREIPQDIPLIFAHHFKKFCNHFAKPETALTEDQIQILQRHNWPGNVRELRNLAERGAILGLARAIQDLAAFMPSASNSAPQLTAGFLPLREFRKNLEIDYIKQVLAHTKGNVTQAARVLELDRVSLHQKIAAYGLKG